MAEDSTYSASLPAGSSGPLSPFIYEERERVHQACVSNGVSLNLVKQVACFSNFPADSHPFPFPHCLRYFKGTDCLIHLLHVPP